MSAIAKRILTTLLDVTRLVIRRIFRGSDEDENNNSGGGGGGHNSNQQWYVCVAVLFVTVIRSGLHYSYGEFLVGLRDDFVDSVELAVDAEDVGVLTAASASTANASSLPERLITHSNFSMTEANWIGTLVMTISMSLAPVSVAFIRRMDVRRAYKISMFGGLLLCAISCFLSSLVPSIRWLLLTYSLLQGIGTSISYMANSLILVEYFDKSNKYHVLGTSILYCGYPLGSVLCNPLYAKIVDEYGWRVAWRIAAVGLVVTAVLASPIFEPHPSLLNKKEEQVRTRREGQGQQQQPDSSADASSGLILVLSALFRRPEVALWFSVNILTFLGFYMPVVNLPSYMRDAGYVGAAVSIAVTVLSFAEIVAYIAASLVGDWLQGRLLITNCISSLALAGLFFVWPWADNGGGYATIIALATGAGLFLGLAIVYTFAEAIDVTGLPQDIAWSYTNTCSGLGLLIGPIFSGGIYDIRKDYGDVFYALAVIFALQFALYCLLVYVMFKRQQQQQQQQQQQVAANAASAITAAVASLPLSHGNYYNDAERQSSSYHGISTTSSATAVRSLPQHAGYGHVPSVDEDYYYDHHHHHHDEGDDRDDNDEDGNNAAMINNQPSFIGDGYATNRTRRPQTIGDVNRNEDDEDVQQPVFLYPNSSLA